MAYKGELPGRGALQVELENAGYDIFTGAVTALTENLPALFEEKPLRSMTLKFGKFFSDRRSPQQLDEIEGELLEISVVDPDRVVQSTKSVLPEDVFIHPRLPKYVKEHIHTEAKRVGAMTLQQALENTVSRRAIITDYTVKYFNGEQNSVDTNEYKPDTILLTSGRMFAKEVLEYMKTDLYLRRPSFYTELYDESSDGQITHQVAVNYASRPPVNGNEPEAWLKAYAKWLESTITQRTNEPKGTASKRRVRGVSDALMNDGILWINVTEAIKRRP